MRQKPVLIAVVMLSMSSICPLSSASEGQEDSSIKSKRLHGLELVRELQKGGHILYLRHATTNKDEKDLDIENLENCSTQRNLSKEGRKQAERIGKAIRKLGIQIDEVISSPYCRCLDTAKLAFGKAKPSKHLYFAIGVTEEERKELTRSLQRMLATPPPMNKTTVLVSHTANLKEAAGIWPKPEGVAVVIKPLGKNKFQCLSSIAPKEWEEILKQAEGK